MSGRRALRTALLITIVFMGVEVLAGILSGSLALLADAGHMFTDAASLGLGLFAFWLSSRPRTEARTFGFRRFEVFAALINGISIWLIAGLIGWEALSRLREPPPINAGTMGVVGLVGLASNAAVAAILLPARSRSLNVRGAFLHVLADGLGSLGLILAAVLIKATGRFFWDPAVSLGICLLILLSSIRLIKESFHILMEGTPSHLDTEAVGKALASIPGVTGVHDLHIWMIASEFVSLSAHLNVPKTCDSREIFRRAQDILRSEFQISHSTLQLEIQDEGSCPTESCDECTPD